jgi:hypothetical protein
MALTPEQRTLRSRAAAYAQWSKTADWSARTAAARAAFLSRFEREVDPDGRLEPGERARRVAAARKSYMDRLALASSRARAARKAGDGDAAQ